MVTKDVLYEVRDRRHGDILQIQKNIYAVLDGSIYNKDGVKMQSHVNHGGYCKIGRMYQGHSGNWYHEDMLQLRR